MSYVIHKIVSIKRCQSYEYCTPTESSRPPVEPHPAKESVRIVVSVDSKIAFFIKIPSQNREVLW